MNPIGIDRNRRHVFFNIRNGHHAFLDGGALRTYRHAPNTGSRKSWAAGDATSRAVRHALFAMADEMGCPGALTARIWLGARLGRAEPVSPGGWDTRLGEFILKYDDVRAAANPGQAVLNFCQSTYEAGAKLAKWDRKALERSGAV